MGKQDVIDQLRSQISAYETGSVPEGRVTAKRSSGTPSRTQKVDMASCDDALKKIVALVNVSDRSEKAIRERLTQTGFTPDAIEEAVTQAKTYGMIDDMRYASVLIRSRIAQGKGLSGIARELDGHNIDIDLVPGWPEEFDIDESTEIERAVALLEKRPPRSKNLREGAYRKLVSKGFSSSVASMASRMWTDSLQP